ncbi:HD domain-containing protein [Thiomicrorhabdus arctica]|uniref:HD domain-containing protein n=1 Tax=Thiomicrorhabdus arctica TaxID=131540 RepID=UPI00037A6666|nr:HD domain-containing protein [Thiomicrorhabdus arctica]
MKTIADPLYGSIQLRPIEAEIINTATFQRLHNVKQLGQANLIFPGANYSRFSHSIGALRNAGKMLQALKANDHSLSAQIEPVETKYRLAALMHDIGHFPFSHATEGALKQYKKDMDSEGYTGDRCEVISNHEAFGELIIMNSPEIQSILEKAGLDAADVASVFASNDVGINEGALNLKPIISSELDCDRMDYLKRTSHFTGLPYGNVDIDYLISNTRYINGQICFAGKAKKSIDHMLLARFHDYQQVVFHKKLIPLEWSLIECVKEAAHSRIIDVSQEQLIDRIQKGDIRGFDDNEIISAIKVLETHYNKRHNMQKANAYHINAVLYGAAAIQVCSFQEYIHGSELEVHIKARIEVEKIVEEYCTKQGIDPDYVYLWSKEHYISKVPPSLLCSKDGLDSIPNKEELVFITDLSYAEKPKPLIELPDSMIRILAEQNLSDIRVFILPIDNHEQYVSELSQLIQQFFKDAYTY